MIDPTWRVDFQLTHLGPLQVRKHELSDCVSALLKDNITRMLSCLSICALIIKNSSPKLAMDTPLSSYSNCPSTAISGKSINRRLSLLCPSHFQDTFCNLFHFSVSFLHFCIHGTQEKITFLTISRSNVVLVLTRHTWSKHPVFTNSSWDKGTEGAI